jgi:hypothetical protein
MRERAYIYMRDEYPAVLDILRTEIAALEEAGSSEPGYIELRRGAGAYICGEESAMIESIEGKRGLPRHRPPYVAQVGLFGRPTLVHNVETVCTGSRHSGQGARPGSPIRARRSQGPALLLGLGPREEPGRQACARRHHMRELIDEHCGGMLEGHSFQGLSARRCVRRHPARLHGRCAARFRQAGRAGCFVGSHAVVVFPTRTTWPWRSTCCSSSKMKAAASARPAGSAAKSGQADGRAQMGCGRCSKSYPQVMADASICGLGQAAPNPIRSVLKYFPTPEDSIMSDAKRIRDHLHARRHAKSPRAGRNHLAGGQTRRHGHPASVLRAGAGLPADGNCRACMVEVEGERTLAASCIREPAEGMVVNTRTSAPRRPVTW